MDIEKIIQEDLKDRSLQGLQNGLVDELVESLPFQGKIWEFKPPPRSPSYAVVAQLVESQISNLIVAGPSPVYRSIGSDGLCPQL